jgi:serine/threonine protein kinase
VSPDSSSRSALCLGLPFDFDYKNMDVIKKIKNYTINERHCLGEGSFGKVYEATSDEGRKVAIKRVEQKLICSDRYLK